MSKLDLVPEEFRDRSHLQQIRQRIIGLAVLVAAAFVAASALCLLGARHGAAPPWKLLIPGATIAVAFALTSLNGQRNKLAEVDPGEIMTFIESCDQDTTGVDSARVSALAAELYAGQGFLTRAQFARITAMLHGQVRRNTQGAEMRLPFDENHELA